MLCLPLYVENETKRHDMVVKRMVRLKEKYEFASLTIGIMEYWVSISPHSH